MYGYGYRYNSGLVVGSGGGGGGFVNTYSTLFDGVDDYLDVTNSFDFSGDFTLSAWVYPTSFGTYNMIFSWAVAGTDSYIAFRSGGRLYYYDGSFVIGTNFGFASLNTWQNIVVRREGTTITFFNNTTKFESPFPSTGKDNSGTLSIGRWAQSSLYLFNGNIDEVSVFDSALSDSEISDIYNSGNPTDLTSLSPVGWYRMGDNGSYKSPQWLIPNNENFAANKVSNYSFELDGIDDYISIANNTDLNFSSAYSVSFWIKTTSAALLSPISNQSKFLIRLYAPVNQIRLQLYDGSNGFLNLDNTQVFNDGNWHHIAFTTEATTTADKVIVYFDGVALTNKGTQLNVGSNLSAFPYEIGRNSGTWNFNGGIDEVSLYDSELSASQINDIYNGGEPTTISGAVAHYKMGEEATFSGGVWTVPDSAGSNNGTSNAMTIDDRVGEAPNSTSNSVSYNMDLVDRVEDTP